MKVLGIGNAIVDVICKVDENFLTKKNPIDVVFVLEDEFDGETATEGENYSLVRSITVGISSEYHYAVKSGDTEKEIIISGGYRVLSYELNNSYFVSGKHNLKIDHGTSE